MTNTLVTCSIIAKESLAILKNMLTFAGAANRDWQNEYGGNMSRGYAPGQTINIMKPPRYTYRAGPVASPQSTVQTTVPVTLSQGGCDINFNGLEQTVSITDSRMQDALNAAVATVCNEIDRQGAQLLRYSTFNTLNAAGTAITTQIGAVQAIANMNRRLDEMAAPRDRRRNLIMNPALNAQLIPGFSGLFNSQSVLDKQFKSGMMVDSLGLSYAIDQNMPTHTNGAATATNINGANQTGSTITVVAVAGGTLTKGTVIQLPGVNAVNPQSRQDTGVAMDFVVTADAALGATSISISPAIVTSGAFQNVTASPTTATPYVISGAASTTYGLSGAFHRDAFTLAMVPLWQPPKRGVLDAATVSDDGFTLSVTKFFDGINYNAITRLDVLFGWAATYPELSCRWYNT